MICKPSDKEEIVELLNYFFESHQQNDLSDQDDPANVEYEEIKLAIVCSIENFLRKPNMTELAFPISFSTTEQRLVQIVAEKLGLMCQINKKSKYQSSVVVYKNDIVSIFNQPFPLNITWNSRRAISQVLLSNPLTLKEKQEIQQKGDKDIRDDRHRSTTGKLMGAVPQVPVVKVNSIESCYSAETLQSPVWSKENEIIDAIKQNQIVLIFSAAGCGKTTQIAQMVMRDCGKMGEPCRMICTQPYRLTAHANAQFVTQQRKENIGQTVGYQIRLESKVSPRTLLTFCTNEVLLRTLYGDRAFLNGTTHIIIDELQERCKHGDLLLTILKKLQKTHHHLKIIILISTPALSDDILPLSISDAKNSYYYRNLNINTAVAHENYFVDAIRQYLDYCPVIHIRKSVQDIEELFLDDILKIIDFKLESIDQNKYLYKVDLYKLTFEKWLSCWTFKPKIVGNLDLSLFELFYKTANPHLYSTTNPKQINPGIAQPKCAPSGSTMNNEYSNQVDYLPLYDDILWSLWSRQDIGDVPSDANWDSDVSDTQSIPKQPGVLGNNDFGDNYFKMLSSIITSGYISVNHQHRMSGLSALMICAFRGFKNGVKRLLSLGADVSMPFVVTDTIFHAFKSFLNHLQNSKQLNNSILLFYDILTCGHNHIGTNNVLFPSDLAIITRNFETAELILGRVVCDTENTYSATVIPTSNERCFVPSSPLIKHDILFKIIFGILEVLDRNTETGTILIFLPDYNCLVELKCFLLNNTSEIFSDHKRYQIYLLHSRMMIQDLNSLLCQSAGNCRKIILTSNIGESSMNIDDVSFVIDSGLESKRVYDEVFGLSTFKTIHISKSQVALRASRATNYNSRVCFHLFSLSQYQSMTEHKVAEILTSPLNEVILQIKLLTAVGVPITQFIDSMLDCPSTESVKASMQLLKSIDALDNFDEMTELGFHLYDLPLDPKYGKMVVSSVILKCLDPILTISCILNYQDPFIAVNCGHESRDLHEVKKKFAANTYSDHIVLLRAFQFWQKSRAEGWERTFCQKNFLSCAVFEIIIGIRTRLLGQLRASGFVKARGNGDIRDLNYNSENWAVVKAAIVSGLANNYMHYNSENGVLVSGINAKVQTHPSSTLHSAESPSSIIAANHSTNMFIYDKALTVPNISNNNWSDYEPLMTNNKTTYVNYITMVTPLTVSLVGSNVNIVQSAVDNQKSWRMRHNDNNDTSHDSIGNYENSVEFKTDEETAQLITKLRHKWQSLILRKLKNPAKQYTPQDETILRTIVNVLTLEEQYYSLKQPSGVGARPRPMALECCNQNDLIPDTNNINMSYNPKCSTEFVSLNDTYISTSGNSECEHSANSWLSKNKALEKKDPMNTPLSQTDKSKLFNNDTNHFFIIKLLHEDEMCGISESKIYKVNISLKLQIENLLISGFNIFFIFINGGSNITLGYAKILHIITQDFYEFRNCIEETYINDIRNQTFSLSLDVFPDKSEHPQQALDLFPLSSYPSTGQIMNMRTMTIHEGTQDPVSYNRNDNLLMMAQLQNTNKLPK